MSTNVEHTIQLYSQSFSSLFTSFQFFLPYSISVLHVSRSSYLSSLYSIQFSLIPSLVRSYSPHSIIPPLFLPVFISPLFSSFHNFSLIPSLVHPVFSFHHFHPLILSLPFLPSVSLRFFFFFLCVI